MDRIILAVACCCLSARFASAAENRIWTDNSGKHTVEAELIEFRGDEVWLKRAAGEPFAVPLARLSDADRRYLASLKREKTNPEAEEPAPSPQAAKFLRALEIYRPKEIKSLEARIDWIKKTLAAADRRPADPDPTRAGGDARMATPSDPPRLQEAFRRGALKNYARLRQALLDELRESQKRIAELRNGKVVMPVLHTGNLREGQIGRFQPKVRFKVEAVEGPDAMVVSWHSSTIEPNPGLPAQGALTEVSIGGAQLRIRGVSTANLQARQMPVRGGTATPVDRALGGVVFEILPKEPAANGTRILVLRPFDMSDVGPLLDASGKKRAAATP